MNKEQRELSEDLIEHNLSNILSVFGVYDKKDCETARRNKDMTLERISEALKHDDHEVIFRRVASVFQLIRYHNQHLDKYQQVRGAHQ